MERSIASGISSIITIPPTSLNFALPVAHPFFGCIIPHSFPKARLLLRQDLEDEYDPLDVPAKHKKSSMFKDMGVLFTGVSEVEGGRMKLEDYVESYAG